MQFLFCFVEFLCTEFKTLRLRVVNQDLGAAQVDLERLQLLLNQGDGIHEFLVVLRLNVLVLGTLDELAKLVAHLISGLVHAFSHNLSPSHNEVDRVFLEVEPGVLFAVDVILNVLRSHCCILIFNICCIKNQFYDNLNPKMLF